MRARARARGCARVFSSLAVLDRRHSAGGIERVGNGRCPLRGGTRSEGWPRGRSMYRMLRGCSRARGIRSAPGTLACDLVAGEGRGAWRPFLLAIPFLRRTPRRTSPCATYAFPLHSFQATSTIDIQTNIAKTWMRTCTSGSCMQVKCSPSFFCCARSRVFVYPLAMYVQPVCVFECVSLRVWVCLCVLLYLCALLRWCFRKDNAGNVLG
jgi:hypothetical protein